MFYYAIDVLILASQSVMSEPPSVRRGLLRSHILPKLGEPIRHCPELNAGLPDVIASVRTAGVEGVVAKRLDSANERAADPSQGARCGSIWARKCRRRQQQLRLGESGFDLLRGHD